jgi:tetratricopeptide (TPR) repeat protein
LNTKNFIKAEQFLRKVLIRNNTAEYNYILGNTLKIQDKNDDAIIAYKKSISLNNNFSEAYINKIKLMKLTSDNKCR